MKRINVEKILLLLVYSLPLWFQVSSIVNNSNIYKVIYLFIISSYFLAYKKIRINLTILKLFMVASITYWIIPLLSMKIDIESIMYYILILIFIYVIIISANSFLYNKEKALKFLLIFNTLPLVYQIIIYNSEFNFTSIMSMFNGDRFNRASYGYSHPNFTAMFLLLEIILIYCQLKEKKINILYFFIFLIILFSTGSRSALLALVVFLITELIIKFSQFFGRYKNYIYSLIMISFIIISIFTIGKELILESSGRFDILLDNLIYIIENNILFFGNGGGSTSNVSSISGIRFSDNWYMTVIINYGIIGLILMVTFIIIIMKKIVKYNSIDSLGMSLIIMMIIYSLSENMLFVPGVCLSWLLWTYIIYIDKIRGSL